MRPQDLMYHLGYPSGIGRVAEYHPKRLLGETQAGSTTGRKMPDLGAAFSAAEEIARENVPQIPGNRKQDGGWLKKFSIKTVAPQDVVCVCSPQGLKPTVGDASDLSGFPLDGRAHQVEDCPPILMLVRPAVNEASRTSQGGASYHASPVLFGGNAVKLFKIECTFCSDFCSSSLA